MKTIALLIVTALLPLMMSIMSASAADYRGGYYGGPRYDGGPRFYGPRVVAGPRYVYAPRVRFGGYPYFAGYAGAEPYGAGCYRWRIVATSIGPQWRMANQCYAPVYRVPVYYGYGGYFY